MKKIMTVALVFGSLSALAAEIKVTSFNYVGQQSRVAELCGVVSGHEGHAHIRIAVDDQTSKPGIYNTIAGTDGKFCAIVMSYSGRANVTLFDDHKGQIALIK